MFCRGSDFLILGEADMVLSMGDACMYGYVGEKVGELCRKVHRHSNMYGLMYAYGKDFLTWVPRRSRLGTLKNILGYFVKVIGVLVVRPGHWGLWHGCIMNSIVSQISLFFSVDCTRFLSFFFVMGKLG